jgi:hypothetical protein
MVLWVWLAVAATARFLYSLFFTIVFQHGHFGGHLRLMVSSATLALVAQPAASRWPSTSTALWQADSACCNETSKVFHVPGYDFSIVAFRAGL